MGPAGPQVEFSVLKSQPRDQLGHKYGCTEDRYASPTITPHVNHPREVGVREREGGRGRERENSIGPLQLMYTNRETIHKQSIEYTRQPPSKPSKIRTLER